MNKKAANLHPPDGISIPVAPPGPLPLDDPYGYPGKVPPPPPAPPFESCIPDMPNPPPVPPRPPKDILMIHIEGIQAEIQACAAEIKHYESKLSEVMLEEKKNPSRPTYAPSGGCWCGELPPWTNTTYRIIDLQNEKTRLQQKLHEAICAYGARKPV